ncbi:MAG: glycosyltransferase family 39 protein [Candidatus Bipolaricaulia bacterium]
MNLRQQLQKPDVLFPLFIVVLIVPILFWGLGTGSLWNPDEGLYAEIAREMLEQGDWVVPIYNYDTLVFDKPPLIYWLSALFYRIFGVGEFAFRFQSAFFGLAGALVIYGLGRTLYNARVGLLSGLIYGSSLGIAVESHTGYMDNALTFWIAAGLLCFWWGQQERHSPYYLLFAICLSFGTLTKGPIAILIPGLVILLTWGLRPILRTLSNPWMLASIGLYGLIIGPWHGAIGVRFGADWWNSYFGYHMLTRFSSPILGTEPWYYYIPMTFLILLPWSGFLPAALWKAGKEAWRRASVDRANRVRARFLMIWFAVVFVFFSLAQTKLGTYIFPLIPPGVLLLGRWWEGLFGDDSSKAQIRTSRIGITLSPLIGIGLLFLAFALASVHPTVRTYVETSWPGGMEAYHAISGSLFLITGLYIAMTFLAYLVHRWRPTPMVPFLALTLSSGLLILLMSVQVVPLVEPFKPVKSLAVPIRERIQPDVRVGSYLRASGIGDMSAPFYTRHPVTFLTSAEEVSAFLTQDAESYLLIGVEAYRPLEEWIKARTPTVRILAQEGQALLVTNRP